MQSKKHEWAKAALEAVEPFRTDQEFRSAAQSLPAFLYQTGLLNAYLQYGKKNQSIQTELKLCIERAMPDLEEKTLEAMRPYSTVNNEDQDYLIVAIPQLDVHQYYLLLDECLGFASQLKLYAELLIPKP